LALNFDGPDSDPVRRYFIENALHWVAEYGIDALRLDAVHAIADASERPFLQELATELHALGDRLGRRVYGIAESDLNTLGFLRSPDHGGCGLDAQWTDDFHHALHTLLTGENSGYYRDFGCLGQLAKSYQGGFIYTGQYSPFRRRRHGVPAAEMAGYRHVVCSQNHDQTGNRMRGERLTALVSFESLKLAAGAVLLSPFLPLLFMGEEYGEPAPFQYFVSHSDEDLIAAVRNGRKEEFAFFGWNEDPPDPQAEETFQRARLDHTLREQEPHRTLEAFYRELIRLRRSLPALRNLSKENVEATALENERILLVRRREEGSEILIALNFGPEEVEGAPLSLPEGRWRKLLDSSEDRWRGPGTLVPETVSLPGEAAPRLVGRAVVVFERE
jgi:maltooligosyltrehalose trehalohydrolase